MHGGSDAGSSVVRSAVNWLGGVGSMVGRVGVIDSTARWVDGVGKILYAVLSSTGLPLVFPDHLG